MKQLFPRGKRIRPTDKDLGIPRKRRAEGAEQRACPDRLPETAQNPYLPVLRQYNKRNSAMEVEEG